MIDSKITVYADYGVLEDIALDSDGYPKLTAVLKRMAYICLNITDSQLESMQSMTSEGVCDPVWQYVQDKDLPAPIALDSFFSQENEEQIYLHDPTAVFLLEKTEEQAKSLRNKYGVLVLGKTEINDDIFQLNNKRRKELNQRNTVFGSNPNGWATVFDNIPRFRDKPFNAAVISDNFLMENRYNNVFYGTSNLLNLFESILPKTLCVPFQILIICPDCQRAPNQAKPALEKFSEDVKKLRKYPIEVEFCITEKIPIHHRKLYTNYFSITCEKGFAIFKVQPGNVVREDGNEIRIESYYHDPIYTSGDTDLEDVSNDLAQLKSIYKNRLQTEPHNRLLL